VAADGSDHSVRTVDYLLGQLRPIVEGAEIHLINVQPSLPFGGHVTSVVGHSTVEEYHKEEGGKALQAVRQKLDAAGIGYHCHIAVGEPAEVIVHYAREHAIEQIVMGTHGRGAVASALMGSVARDVLANSPVPVVLVK
jgi:nucleotide-binding universal stress UspA family protein